MGVSWTPRPGATRTKTPTPLQMGQQEQPASPTPACNMVQVIGEVLDVTGGYAANRRVSFSTDKVQAVPNDCVVRQSLFSVMTDTFGQLPDGTFLVGGSDVLVAIENGKSQTIFIPMDGPVRLVDLLAHPTPHPSTSIQSVTVSSGGSNDYELTIDQPEGYGTLTLIPGNVVQWTLQAGADGGGQFIEHLGEPVASTDAVAWGTDATGDLSGTWPQVNVRSAPIDGGTFDTPDGTNDPGYCFFTEVPVAQALDTMLPLITPRPQPSQYMTWGAWIPAGGGRVRVRACVLSTLPAGHTSEHWQEATWQIQLFP